MCTKEKDHNEPTLPFQGSQPLPFSCIWESNKGSQEGSIINLFLVILYKHE